MIENGQSERLLFEQTERSDHRNGIDTITPEASERNYQSTSAGLSDLDEIARYTCISECPNSDCVSMLTARANALAGTGRQEGAVKDSIKANQPTSPESYITAGYIYTMQSKRQAAVEIPETGLSLVPPSEQAMLHERLATAKKLQEQGIDFVAKLPIEIVIDIFTHLDNDIALISCTTVSKIWRHILLEQCPELWRAAIFGFSYHWNPTAQLVPLISYHVQNLEVDTGDDGRILRTLADMGATNKFPSITSLTIVTEYPMLMIPLLGETLTSVTINIEVFNYGIGYGDPEPSDFPLELVLTACSSLKELSIESNDPITYQRLNVSPFDGYQLTSLFIKSAYYIVPMLERLIPDCPRLERLYAINSIYPIIMPLLEQHCPLLVHLASIEEPPTSKFVNNKSVSNRNNGQPGLHTLQYGIPNMHHIQAAISVVKRSSRTLTTLDLTMTSIYAFQEGLDQLAAIELSHVRNLGLRIGYNDGHAQHFGSFVAAVIQHCPALESVIVSFDLAPLSDQFFMCLSTHRQLHTMEVLGVESHASGFQQLLTHISTLESQCTLTDVTIQSSKIVDDELLNTLTDISTVQIIKISCQGLDYNVTGDGVATFIGKLKAMPQLKELHLRAMPHISDPTICQLAEIDGLQTLSLTDIDDITTDGVRAMAKQLCTSLKTVIVSGQQVNYDIEEYLQKVILRW